MKTAYIADVHVDNYNYHGGAVLGSINDRCIMVLDTIMAACKKAQEEGCKRLVVLGDLFNASNPTPQMVFLTATAFKPFKGEVILLLGNHEQVSTYHGDHALIIFNSIPGFRVIDETFFMASTGPPGTVFVPYKPGPAKDWLPEQLEVVKDSTAFKIETLCLHLGVSDERTPPYLRSADDSIDVTVLKQLCGDLGIKNVFTGNWHHRQVWGRGIQEGVEVTQVGTLCPHTFGDDGLNAVGKMAICGDDGHTFWHDISGPRFITMTSAERTIWPPSRNHPTFLRYKLNQADMEKAQAIQMPAHVRVEYVLVDTELKDQVKMAAIAARSAGTLDEAIHDFVKEHPVVLPGTTEGAMRLVKDIGKRAQSA